MTTVIKTFIHLVQKWMTQAVVLCVVFFLLGGGGGVTKGVFACHRHIKIKKRLKRKSRDSSVNEHGTHDQTVTGSIPGRTGERISSPGSIFCTDSYFSICSAPVLPQERIKILIILPKCRWQVTLTAKTYMHATYTDLHGVHRTCAETAILCGNQTVL